MRCADSTTHHVYDWRGTAYDIGLQHGKALKQQIIAECEPVLTQMVDRSCVSRARLLQRFRQTYEPWFQQYTTRALEEIQGIAAGSGLDPDYIFFAAVRDGAKHTLLSEDACTSFYCGGNTTHNRQPLIGQNKDANAPLDRYRIMRRAYDDGLTTLTLNYPGWIANIGMSSHGLGWTGNSLDASKAPGPTVPYSLLRTVIGESTCLQQVKRAIQQLPIDNCCMLIADRDGHALCLESAHGERIITDISGQAFGHANSVLCDALQTYELPPHSPSSPDRQRNIQRRLNESRGKIDIDTLKSILGDHTDAPHSICLHPTKNEPLVTTASFIADLVNQQMHIAIGNPCEQPYRIYEL